MKFLKHDTTYALAEIWTWISCLVIMHSMIRTFFHPCTFQHLNENVFLHLYISILQQGTDELWKIRDDLMIDETGHLSLYTEILIPQRLHHTHNSPETVFLNEDNETCLVCSGQILHWLSYQGSLVSWAG